MSDPGADSSDAYVTFDEALASLGQRIDRMALDPESVTSTWTTRLARPFYRLLGWQPELSVVRMGELFAELERVSVGELADIDDEVDRAYDELEQNVAIAERACAVNGRVPIAQLAWLTRMTRVLAQAAHALDAPDDVELQSFAAGFDPVLVAPPLAIRREREGEKSRTAEPAVDVEQARLVELQLAAIDHIIAAARSEASFLERRRSLLEAARRLLLDADAALELEADGVRERKRYVAEQIVQVDRVQACGLRPHVSLLHQARGAMARGDHHKLYAALSAMEGMASAAGDLRGASLVKRGLDGIDPGGWSEEADALSIRRSAEQVMDKRVVDTVQRAYRELRNRVETGESKIGASDPEIFQLALDYLAPGAEDAALSAMLSVDGCFDVGAPLAPVRIRDRQVVARVVAHPTQELMLTRARSPADVPSAVLSDPRGVLMDLAAGRLLARKFVQYEERITERVEMMGEVRVYLLDGSTSMLEEPARARMRDAILTAELATLLSRFENPDRFTRVLMFYRYFTKRIWPLTRVSDPAGALTSIGAITGKQWEGGTDIEKALTTCFDMIRTAREEDGDLARGQVVLITDGEAQVRERVIRAARERVGEIPISVSVIALGEENHALRSLVARQRARGERAFYHHIDDDTLHALASGDLGGVRSLHLPDDDAEPWSRDDLEEAVGDVLEEAADLERRRHQMMLHTSDDLEAAFAELGLTADMMTDGQRARAEAAARDRRALLGRYHRWFPAPGDLVVLDDEPSENDDAMVLVLTTVAEVASELYGDELSRKADAIDVLERLLPDARLSPAVYDAEVAEPTSRIVEALEAVHRATTAHQGETSSGRKGAG